MAKEPPEIPQGMRRVYRRFERWRSAHPGVRLPIPKSLWASAAKAAREHGVCPTAKLLCLEYSKLKRMAESGSATTAPAPGSRRGAPMGKARRGWPAKRRVADMVPVSKFMELVGSPAIGLSECLIELEGPRGKMRIQWKGTTTPDLAGLSRILWEPA
jgi:hypothetical protein